MNQFRTTEMNRESRTKDGERLGWAGVYELMGSKKGLYRMSVFAVIIRH